uniref:Uncharacterized protein n=1 Tax=Thermogladius calderae TaxID=1200300 RepID=A0A7J3Y0L2_9CREN
MVNYKSLLRAIIPRVVTLLLVYYVVIVNYNLLSIRIAGLDMVNMALTIVAWGLLAATVITASPQFYGVTVIFLTLLPTGSNPSLLIPALAGYFLLLFLDNFVSNYNVNQYGWLKHRPGGNYTGILQILVFIVGMAGIAFLVSRLWVLFYETIISSSASGFSVLLISTYLFRLLMLVAVLAISIYSVRELFTIAFFYVKPNAILARVVLLDEASINVFYTPTLNTLKGMIIASVFAPLIYQPLYELWGPLLAGWMVFLGGYSTMVSSVILALFAWVLLTIIMRRVDSALTNTPLQMLLASTILLALTYFGGVYYEYKACGDIWSSLLHPDFNSWSLSVVSAYSSYYTTFYSLIEFIPKIMGAVP